MVRGHWAGATSCRLTDQARSWVCYSMIEIAIEECRRDGLPHANSAPCRIKAPRARPCRSHGVKAWNVSSIRGEHAAHAFTAATSNAT